MYFRYLQYNACKTHNFWRQKYFLKVLFIICPPLWTLPVPCWSCFYVHERVRCVCVPRCLIRPRVARGVGRAAVQCCRGIYPPLLLGAACWAVLLYTAHCCWAGEEEEPLQPGVSGRAPPPHTQTHHNNAPAHADHCTGPLWQYQPGDTAAMLTNVGHHTALTGLRWLAAVVGNTYTLHSAF